MPTGIYPRIKKPFLCGLCGENNPKNFYSNHERTRCKKCIRKRNKIHGERAGRLCRKCGESDPTKFSPSVYYQCRSCRKIVAKRWKDKNLDKIKVRKNQYYEQNKQLYNEYSKKSAAKYKDIIRERQRLRRVQNINSRRLKDRLDCDVRRVFGISTSECNTEHFRALMLIRLLKLKRGGTISIERIKAVQKGFELDPFNTLLSLYGYRTIPNVLGRVTQSVVQNIGRIKNVND